MTAWRQQRRNLVVLRAGEGSLHEQWLDGSQPRTWDLVVSYFGDDPDRFRTDDVLRLDRKGTKWTALHHVLTVDLAEVIDDYDYIWLPDDDLAADTDTINDIFEYTARYQLSLSQPALTEDSYFTHEITLVDRRYELRYTNFVEIMAPCFHRDFLLKCLPTFAVTQTGWGLDFHWPKLVPDTYSIAILDAATVRHTRPVGGPNLTAARATGIDPWKEYAEYLVQHEIYDLTTRVHQGVGVGRPRATEEPIAICATIDRYRPGLPTWLNHHGAHANLLIVYSDDPTVRTLIDNSEFPIMLCDNTVDAADPDEREVANIGAAIAAARTAGMEWLLPLGPHELFHDDGSRHWQISGADQVVFLAHEAVPMPHPVSDPFRECTVFRMHGRAPFLDAPATRSAVRLSAADIAPADKHGFTGFAGASGTVSAPVILHYPYPSFESWLTRAERVGNLGGVAARDFADYSRNLLHVAVAHGTLEGARACFQADIPRDGMVDQMVRTGELTRIHPDLFAPRTPRMTRRPPANSSYPDMAIIYWFYKEPEVTLDHLRLLRQHNPDRPIFGLFGGQIHEAAAYRDLLGDLLDDFWCYEGTYGNDPYTKWMHGDLLILDWYDKRGRFLAWELVTIVQWDMLVFADLTTLFPDIKPDQAYFSGYQELDDDIEWRWPWTSPDGGHRDDYLAFTQAITTQYGYTGPKKCCFYILEILPKRFFDGHLGLADKHLGMLEYKNPTLAAVFDIDIHHRDIGVRWSEKHQSITQAPINPMKMEITTNYIDTELADPTGWRLFHPYSTVWTGSTHS
ncbi:DUF707 domain-containing protein [Nocardia sp. MW-W600-9]